MHEFVVEGRLCGYDVAAPVGPLRPVVVFEPVAGDEIVEGVISADRRWAVYTTLHATVCVAEGGSEIWRWDFEPAATEKHGHSPGCVLAQGDREVWVYRADAMAGRGPDLWAVLDAANGEVLASTELETVGHGATQIAHPSDGHVLLNVGEGQDGTIIYLGALRDRLELTRFPWDDRVLIGLAPDGTRFMTVDHSQGDVAFHSHPDGTVLFSLDVDAFGKDAEDVFVEWAGGFLTAETAVVALVGDEEWFGHFLVDVTTGTVVGEFASDAEDAEDVRPLGNGSWLTTSRSGSPALWR